MRIHPYQIGDLVKARPWLRAPKDPQHSRPFRWPYFYPARLTDLIGDDGAVLEFCGYAEGSEYSGVITPWPKSLGYSVSELHAIDCTCAGCEPSEDLTDPRGLIDRLTGNLEGVGVRRAERTDRLLHDARFEGNLLLVESADLIRGDFLLYPHQHLHAVSESRGDVEVRTCTRTLIFGPHEIHVVFRPDRPAPVCDAASPHHDERLAPAAEPGARSTLETAVHAALGDLGLVAPTQQPEHETTP